MSRSELATRSLTGILIAAITLSAIVYADWTCLLWFCFITMFCTYEFQQLEHKRPPSVEAMVLPVFLAMVTGLAGYQILTSQPIMLAFAVLGTGMCLWVFLQMLRIKTPVELTHTCRIGFAAAGYIAIPMICGTLLLSVEYDWKIVLIPVVLIWANDIGAYLIGSRWGKNKIAPLISPGKSIEGTIGGGILTLGIGLLLMQCWPDIPAGYTFTITLVTPVMAYVGDLWESAIKRTSGAKDSGKWLPGHGGILDRYDSLLFVLPVSALAYSIFAT